MGTANLNKASDVFVGISAVVLYSAYQAGAKKGSFEEFVEGFTTEISAAFKDDILTIVKSLLNSKTGVNTD